MSTEQSYETYYVPHNSKLPIFASIGIFLLLVGMGKNFNDMTAGMESSIGGWISSVGFIVLGLTLFTWFSTVIRENHEKLNSAQMKRSYVWGMTWFIFSEVMFFAAFFGALFYVRFYVVDWIGGVGDRGPSNLEWPDYVPHWPMLETPNPAQYPGAAEAMGWWGLPLINTIVLLASSGTITIAHHGVNEGNRSKLIIWLAITVLLGVFFLILQAYEYYHAYTEMGLTLQAGIYGTTFFMLTGFHGAHVTLGTFMLLIQLFRAMKGHFTKEDCFGFEASAWYWHFVDVVWIGLFIFVYILGS
ncbi:MAG: cytochrome c oxidase subunit 3 [Gammaproteobacteria bacterium]|nr:cytochrome c oxidase subunit 3 [Gammaproteobacteria bacterium]